MTHHKKYKNESQDARRHDQQNSTHPDAKEQKNRTKTDQNNNKRK